MAAPVPCRWPASISGLQSLLGSFTSAQPAVLYSPACMLHAADPTLQARAVVLSGIITPACVVLVCMLLWAARCAMHGAAEG